MDFNINIRIEVTQEFCRAISSISDVIVSAFCVTATQIQDRPQAAPPEEEEHAPVYVPKTPPAPKEKKPEPPEEPATDFKALRAELKSVMAKAAKDGKAEAVKALLAELGVSKLSQIPEDKLEETLRKAGDI